jgi:hypothetical protein
MFDHLVPNPYWCELAKDLLDLILAFEVILKESSNLNSCSLGCNLACFPFHHQLECRGSNCDYLSQRSGFEIPYGHCRCFIEYR